MLKLFNTLGRKKQVFKPIKANEVGIYTCGPTVYWFQHIGNMRAYIYSDLLKRVLLYNNYKVKHIINITDVGHLTSDADEGEDKMEKAAAKEGKKAEDIAKFYFDEFEQDLKKLNILTPTKWSKATEHIKEQIDLVKTLEKKGFTYQTSDGIYFDTSKINNYGELALLQPEQLKAGKRIDMAEKKNKTDFALWKFSKPEDKRQQEWESPWGKGFPGWHIECSAMSSKYLGKQFDIHTGGEDHIPVHHTNEIAQSEAAFDKKPWVNFWGHVAFLTSKGEKVSKSKGGLFTISELEKQGFSPIDYRYLNLLTHYRKNLDFSLDKLSVAKESFKNLKRKIQDIDDKSKGSSADKHLKDFEKAINDDLNMPLALQALQALVKDDKVSGKSKLEAIKKIDTIFGLDLLKQEKLSIPEEVKTLAKQREQARKNKDFETSDKLRDKIKDLGFQINDTSEGMSLEKL